MFSRILSSIVAASALVTAIPVLANEPAKDTEAQKTPQCCERVAMQMREHHGRTDTTEKQRATSNEPDQKTRVNDFPPAWDPSWGG